MSDAKKILLVDDDGDVLRGAAARLKAAGYQTIAASNGKLGLAAAVSDQPDAIVLDVRMPDMDGLTALGHLQQRDDTRRIPIVMLSACLTAQQAALEGGARFFLTKPYRGSALLAALEAALTQPPDGARKANS